MKKEFFIHFSILILFLFLIALVKGFLNLSSWSFYVGGIVGTILPDLDHLLYVFFLRPQELTSQRVNYMLGKKDFGGSLNLLAETKNERTKLIFHTAFFQIILSILAFWVITSSGSLFGRGLVVAFTLHLITDQLVDLNQFGNLSTWFRDFPIVFPPEKEKLYWGINVVFFLLLAFLF